MNIPLNQFEQYINETILARGLSYFRNGYVSEPEEIAHGVYEAIVEGSENYTVQLSLENGVVTDYVCNCPYDYGPVCKHIAAVLFYLQQDELEIRQKEKKTNGEKPASPSGRKVRKKRKTKADQIVELLEKVSHEELKQFIIERTVHNRSFRDLFLSTYAHYNSNESKKQYSQLVNSILRTASDRHGFIDWSSSRQVGIEISHLLATAQKQIENNNYKSAFYICTAVMEEMTEALQYSDDSNGDIGGSIYSACELFYEIVKNNTNEEIRNSIFDYCVNAFERNVYSGWDWHTDMLQIASIVLKSDSEFDKLMIIMDKHQESEYTQETIQDIKYQILLKVKGENEANIYLEQNISNSRLRRTAIVNSVAKEDFNRARKIAFDGIEHDEKDKPGLAKEWYDWLLKIAQATNDKENIIKYARYLLIDNFRNEQDYYQVLKQYIPQNKWDNYVNDIISDIRKTGRWTAQSLISNIYIREKWWDKLFEFVKQSPSLNTISEYEQYLAKDYSKELSEMYAVAVIKYLEQNMGRKHYQLACRYLRRIIKLGNREKANELIEKFRNDYPARKALMEELNNV